MTLPLQSNYGQLIEITLNIDLNGIECSRFCHDYIMKIRKSVNPATQSLDTGGHTYSDGLALTNMTGQ